MGNFSNKVNYINMGNISNMGYFINVGYLISNVGNISNKINFSNEGNFSNKSSIRKKKRKYIYEGTKIRVMRIIPVTSIISVLLLISAKKKEISKIRVTKVISVMSEI